MARRRWVRAVRKGVWAVWLIEFCDRWPALRHCLLGRDHGPRRDQSCAARIRPFSICDSRAEAQQ